MKNQQKKQYPMIAALLKAKVLKEKKGKAHNHGFDAGLLVVRGHETMEVGLDILTDRLHVIVEGAPQEMETTSEAQALHALFAWTFESTPDYARNYILEQLRSLKLPELAEAFWKATKPEPKPEPEKPLVFEIEFIILRRIDPSRN